MANLTPELMKELIPQVGLRIKFRKKWQEHFKTTENVTSERDKNIISAHDNGSSDEDSTNKENRSFLNEQATTSSSIFRKLQRPSVKDILKGTSQGRAILKSYEKQKLLSRPCRNNIVDLILSEVLNNIHGPLRNEDFEALSKEIEELFPTETCHGYYIPPVPKKHSKNNKSITSRGKLVDKYRNKIRDYKKLTGCSLTDTSSTSPSTSACNSDFEDDSVIRESLLWLESNQSPWQLVENHWKVTVAHRRNQIQKSSNKTIEEIFTQWPILKHPTAHTLIDEDFTYLKLTSEDCIKNWFNFFSKIQEICPVKEEKIVSELHLLLNADDLTDDAKVVIQVLLLSHLIPPKGRIRIKKEHFKPSISECKNSMIVHAKIPGDINRIQEEKVKRAQQLGLTVQPYIIVVGLTLADVNGFYVCIDKVLYEVTTALKAVDLCFKIFHVFDVNYSPESEHIWYILQLCLYKFSTKYDKQISYVMPIIKNFNSMTN
ncbi:uncharacterized protein LOC112458459 isoform X2 [Temnothorax curvispinosus]|nr:uncharacterized protein LOC112458459 isoform X2 [Temnothorax curvispinosus]